MPWYAPDFFGSFDFGALWWFLVVIRMVLEQPKTKPPMQPGRRNRRAVKLEIMQERNGSKRNRPPQTPPRLPKTRLAKPKRALAMCFSRYYKTLLAHSVIESISAVVTSDCLYTCLPSLPYVSLLELCTLQSCDNVTLVRILLHRLGMLSAMLRNLQLTPSTQINRHEHQFHYEVFSKQCASVNSCRRWFHQLPMYICFSSPRMFNLICAFRI